MVIGNGLLANGFEKYKNNPSVVLFCSGVSNSLCTDISEYERERKLLSETISNNSNSTFVYFSTCSIYEKSPNDNKYVAHKLETESFIQDHCSKYLIVRLSNVVGKTKNPNTVINFLFNAIYNNAHFTLWEHAYRNLIDVDDVAKIVSHIIDSNLFSNEIINVANVRSVSVPALVSKIEAALGRKGNYEMVSLGKPFDINTYPILPIINLLNIKFDESYTEQLLKKYYLREL